MESKRADAKISSEIKFISKKIKPLRFVLPLTSLFMLASINTGCDSENISQPTPIITNIDRPPHLDSLTPIEENENALFKEKIFSFTWKDAENPEKLKAFVGILADKYLKLTKTSRVNKDDLTEEGKIAFYQNRGDYLNAVKKVFSKYEPDKDEWGYAHYSSGKVFIDMDLLKKQTITQRGKAGLSLLDGVWHEWGHLDITEKNTGELLNDPELHFFSPNSNQNEPFIKYRGAEIFTDTYYGFLRFEEVLNETITVRRMVEQLHLKELAATGKYYPNGVDFFANFTYAHIPLETLYEMHATSNFEGLAKKLGENLPGKESPLAKGVNLAVAIHQSDPTWIKQTGVFERIPKNKSLLK